MERAPFTVGAPLRAQAPVPLSLAERAATVSSSGGKQLLEGTFIGSVFYRQSTWAPEGSWGGRSGQRGQKPP